MALSKASSTGRTKYASLPYFILKNLNSDPDGAIQFPSGFLK